MSIKDRFKMIMEREQLNAVAFAESIGVAQATISHILGPRNKYPSTEVIMRLQQRYPDINLNWLLTGTGNMSNDAPSVPQQPSPAELTERDETGYPLFAENALHATDRPVDAEKRKEMGTGKPDYAPQEIVRQEVVYKEKPARRITEIRIFFDDNTYETFKPEK